MFYDRYVQICREHGVSPSRAAIDAGLSKSTVSKWKSTQDAKPTGAAIQKLTAYFGITIAELLGEDNHAPAVAGKRAVTDDDIKFALFGGDGEVTDAMYDEVRRFAAYVKQRRREPQ